MLQDLDVTLTIRIKQYVGQINGFLDEGVALYKGGLCC